MQTLQIDGGGVYAGPNLKALRRILAALIISAALCFAICLALILHAPKPQQRQIRRAETRTECHCQGQCMRTPTR